MRRSDDELRRRAGELGVQVSYEDVDQVVRDADPGALAMVVDVLEADRATHDGSIVDPVHLDARAPIEVGGTITDAELEVDGVTSRLAPSPTGELRLPELPVGCHTVRIEVDGRRVSTLVVVPPPTMPGLDPSRRWTALFAPTYALWDDAGPLPSYRHLRTVADAAAAHGIDMVATLPLYATFLDEPFDPSPYSPVSRLHWNEAFLDDAELPPLDEPPSAAVSTTADDLGELSLVDWRSLGARRRQQLERAAADLDPATSDAVEAFVREQPDVAAYARFRAGREADPTVERSHRLAQYLCDRALHELRAEGIAHLALDLPIGSHPDGFETWAHPDLFAPATAVGAPPDTFFTEGQNWGFPPQLPGAMRASGYALWRALIERAGRHADLLRIDHVMAVHRLWWIPDGCAADRGVYVTYPEHELLAVIAATAAAAGIGVVGENLGTVPPEVDDALDRWGMLGMYEEQFHLGDELTPVPERSVAGIRTHDMQAFADHVATHDLSGYRAALGRAGITRPPGGPLVDLVLERLLRSDARMVVADLDDLLDERRPHNLPGRVVPGIWQRRLDRPLDAVLGDAAITRRLDLLGGRSR